MSWPSGVALASILIATVVVAAAAAVDDGLQRCLMILHPAVFYCEVVVVFAVVACAVDDDIHVGVDVVDDDYLQGRMVHQQCVERDYYYYYGATKLINVDVALFSHHVVSTSV